MRAEEEEQRRLEEETIRLANEAREAEEQRLRLAIEEAKRREEEDRRKREEETRQKQEKEEAERKAREEAEKSVQNITLSSFVYIYSEISEYLHHIICDICLIVDNESKWLRGLRKKRKNATLDANEWRRSCLGQEAKIKATHLPR